MSFASPLGGPIASAFVEITADTGAADRAISAFIGSLARVGAAASRAGESIEDSFREAARQSNFALRDIGGVATFAPVVAQAEVASERIDNSFRDAARDSNLSLASIGRGALLLSGALAVAGGAIVGFGLSQAAALEQTEIGFRSLLGSAEEADAFIRQLQQFAATTPFEFQGLAENARRLLAIGDAAGFAQADIIPLLTTVGDLTAVLGAPQDSIDRIITAFGQMASRGRVTTEEMLQLSEALPGFNVFQALADGLGVTTGELQELISSGAVPAQEGIALLVQEMGNFQGAAGAMAAQSQTLLGVLSTFKDTVALSLTEAFQPLVPTIKDALTGALPAVEAALATIGPALSGLATTLLGVLSDVLSEVGPGLGTLLQGLSDGLAPLAAALGPLLSAVGDALAGLGPVLATVGEALAPLLEVLGEALGNQLAALLPAVVSLVEALAPLVEIFSDTLLAAVRAFKPVLEALGAVLADVFETLGPVLADVASIIADVLVQAFEVLSPILTEVVEVLGAGLTDVLTTLAPVLRDLAAALAERFLATIEALAPVLPELAEAVVQIAVALAELLVALLPLLIPLIQLQTLLISGIGAPVLLAIAQAVAFLATALAGLVSIVAGAVQPAVSAVTTALSFLWNSVLVPLAGFVQAFVLPVLGVFAAVLLGPTFAAVTLVINTLSFLWRNVFVPVAGFLSGVLSPAVGALSGALSFASGVIGSVRDVLNGFYTSVIQPVATFIRDTFTAAVNGLSGAFGFLTPIIDAAESALDALGDIVSDVIGFVNDLVDAISNIDFPDITPGFDIPGVPGLARGGLGDFGSGAPVILHGREAVIPYDDVARSMQILRATGLFDRAAVQPLPGSTFGGDLGLTGAPVVNVTVHAPGATGDDAERIASASADAMVLALERRRLTFSARMAS